jgi:hypothetical protein
VQTVVSVRFARRSTQAFSASATTRARSSASISARVFEWAAFWGAWIMTPGTRNAEISSGGTCISLT